MATITEPMALDKTFNTTETTPRSQADVLAGIESAIRQGFGQVASAVEYDHTDSGLTADNVQDAIDELAEDKADISEVTEVDTPDTTPFLYRRTPYNADRVFLDELVGGSVAWNQLVPNNDKSKSTTIGSYNYADIEVINNNISTPHFLLAKMSAKVDSGTAYFHVVGKDENDNLVDIGCATDITTTEQYVYILCKLKDYMADYGIIFRAYGTEGQVYSFDDLNVIDLTQMFGTTIADYVYTLEQATAGSGIAWLKSVGFFTKNYYPYNTGELISVKTSGKKYVEKNLIDQTTLDLYDVTGAGTMRAGYAPIKLAAGTYTVSWVSANTPVLLTNITDGYSYSTLTNGGNFTLNSTSEIMIRTGATSVNDVAIYNIQLEKGSTATIYEPYTEHTYDISNIDLRGIPKLVNNELVYDGDTYESNGDVTRKYGIVDLGDLSWVYYSSSWIGAHFYAVFNGIKYAGDYSTTVYPIVCSKYKAAARNLESFLDKCIVIDGDAAPTQIKIKDTNYTDATTFKTAMSGVYLVYELATPTTETTDPYTNPQICDKDGTEEFIDDRTVPIPVGHNSRYADLPAIMDGDYLSYMVGEIEKCAVDAEFMQFTDGTDTFTDVNLSLDASLHTVSVVGSKIEQKRFICFEVMDKMGGVLQGILASCIAFTDGAKTPSGTAFRAYIESLQMYVNFRIYGSGGSYTLAYQSETSFSASAFYVRVRMMNNL